LAQAKCLRCSAQASGSSFEEATKKINHAVGLSRNIPCGASYGRIIDITPKPIVKEAPKKTPKPKEPKVKETKPPETKPPEPQEESVVTKE